MNQCESLACALRAAGHRGLTSMDIIKQCKIVNVTGRIADLRKSGHDIVTKHETRKGKTVWRFVLGYK